MGLLFLKGEKNMDIQECYARIGGDFEEAMGRLAKAERIRKFALMFLKDSSLPALRAALEADDTELAFRQAHTLKGVCLNLSFTALAQDAIAVTEALRAGDLARGKELFPALEGSYTKTIEVLQELAATPA